MIKQRMNAYSLIVSLFLLLVVTVTVIGGAIPFDNPSFSSSSSSLTYIENEPPCPGMFIVSDYHRYTNEIQYYAEIYGTRIPILSPTNVRVQRSNTFSGTGTVPSTVGKFATLGEGAHGAVTEGLYTDNLSTNLSIAIKHVPLSNHYYQSVCELMEEARIMYALYTNTSNTFSSFMVPVLGLIDAYALRIPMHDEIRETFPKTLVYRTTTKVPKHQSLRTPLALVMEKMLCTATDYVHHTNRCHPYPIRSRSSTASLSTRLRIVHEISQALTILHNEVYAAHGDLKGANILITKTGHPVLTDFGRFTPRTGRKYGEEGKFIHPSSPRLGFPTLSPSVSYHHHIHRPLRTTPNANVPLHVANFPEFYIDRSLRNVSSVWLRQYVGKGGNGGGSSSFLQLVSRPVSKVGQGTGNVYTDGYGAPETLYDPSINSPSIATASTDMYAFGVTMWELFVRQVPKNGPYGYLPQYRLLDTAIIAGARPLMDKETMIKDIPEEILGIIRLSWLHERSLRLRAQEVQAILRDVRRKYEKEE